MGRIGKKEIIAPEGVKLEAEGGKVTVSGPKGTLYFQLNPAIQVEVKGQSLVVLDSLKHNGALQGTTRQIIANMVAGVTQGWAKILEVVGTGYRAVLDGEKLIFSLGFSHRVEFPPPEGIKFSVAENKVTVSGADKALVGKIAAQIRQLRKPDAYKGKGIRYEGERIKLKPGKATKMGAVSSK